MASYPLLQMRDDFGLRTLISGLVVSIACYFATDAMSDLIASLS